MQKRNVVFLRKSIINLIQVALRYLWSIRWDSETHLVGTNLLLQLGRRAPDDVTRDQIFCFFYPGQDESLHAVIFLHKFLCLHKQKESYLILLT